MGEDKKEYFSQKYFNNIKIKNLKDFREITPNGNIIEGVICKKPNRFLGSMVIDKIILENKEVIETEQFIQAMPKIHYYDENKKMYSKEEVVYPAYEKLDGTCLILFGLYNNGKVIEIVPKTRGVPVADSFIVDLYNEIDHSNVESFFEMYGDFNPVLLFELFGALNQHSIFYPRTRIDINLIGGSLDGVFLDWYELDYFRDQYDFNRPIKLFSLVYFNNVWRIRFKPGIFFHYAFLECSDEERIEVLRREYDNESDMIQALENFITVINKNFYKVHNRQLLEGVVVNTYNALSKSFVYIKVKSTEIKEMCKLENGVPRKFILKEVRKYFDEYGSRVKDIYISDENHYKEYVNRNLLEEFAPDIVNNNRTQKRVQNIFLDILESKEPPVGLQEICNGLRDKYPELSVSDLMRLFAKEYPEKKRYASTAYQIFEKIV